MGLRNAWSGIFFSSSVSKIFCLLEVLRFSSLMTANDLWIGSCNHLLTIDYLPNAPILKFKLFFPWIQGTLQSKAPNTYKHTHVIMTSDSVGKVSKVILRLLKRRTILHTFSKALWYIYKINRRMIKLWHWNFCWKHDKKIETGVGNTFA